MKMKSASQFLFATTLLLAFAGSAWAGITVTLTSPQNAYTPGQDNTFTFNVGMAYTGAEYVDRYQFVFPADITVVSATPASGSGSCGSNAGIQSICSPSVSWARSGVPCSGAFPSTGCGAYTQAASVFNITVSIPAGFTGSLGVTLNSIGDGFLLPAGTVDTDTVDFALNQVPAVVTTQAVTNIGTTTATGNGNITDLGIPNPTAHGVAWNTIGTPTLADDSTDEGAVAATGAFTSSMTGLSPNTTYYVRAYATNTAETVYGDEVSFSTIAIASIPTLNEWGLICLSMLMMGAGYIAIRRQMNTSD